MQGTHKHMTTKARLDNLTDELSQLLSNEDIDDEMLREASDNLLPALVGALFEAGYGVTYYKIWSNEHKGWWKPNHSGYTPNRMEAGAYTETEARQIVEGANIGLKDVPNEAMVEIVADEPAKI